MPFRFTLVADGTSDRALVPLIEWVLQRAPRVADAGFAVEFTVGEGASRQLDGLAGKIDAARRAFPFDLLFVHRDAEREHATRRRTEIAEAVATLGLELHVPVVPVRMTEAWLLIDESALRMAADNPNGRVAIAMPALRKLEDLPDPKAVCNELLVTASEKQGRRRKQFGTPAELAWRRARIARLIEDFSPLLRLPAFAEFHELTHQCCARL